MYMTEYTIHDIDDAKAFSLTREDVEVSSESSESITYSLLDGNVLRW